MRRAFVAGLAGTIAGCGGLLTAFGEDPTPSPEPVLVEAGGASADASNEATGSTTIDGGNDADAPSTGDAGVGLRVFVTAASFGGSTAMLASNADAHCQDAANVAGLGGTWRAWISHSLRQAANVIEGNGPWRTLKGTVVASDRTQLLSGQLAEPIEVTEAGDTANNWVWTGTGTNGGSMPYTCEDWSPATLDAWGTFGRSRSTDSAWTRWGEAACANNFSLYCFEQP